MAIKGAAEGLRTLGGDARCVAVMDGGGCHQADAGVAMMVVVVLEERRDDIAGMLDAGRRESPGRIGCS